MITQGGGLDFSKMSELGYGSDTILEIRLNLAFFSANTHFLRKILLFTSLKEEEYHFILPSQYKYDFLDGYPRGSAGINMFSISNMSEFVPRGGVDIFQKMSEIQKCLNYPGGGSSLIGNLSLPVFFSNVSP